MLYGQIPILVHDWLLAITGFIKVLKGLLSKKVAFTKYDSVIELSLLPASIPNTIQIGWHKDSEIQLVVIT